MGNSFRLSLQINLAHCLSHIHTLTLPMLMPMIVRSDGDHVSFVEISIAIALLNIVSTIVQVPVGLLVDRLGAKKTLKIAVFLGSLSFTFLFFFNRYPALIIAMIGAGIANAFYHPADYALLSQNIKDHKMGKAFSLHAFSGYVGFGITPSMMYFATKWFDYQAGFLVSGLLGFITFLCLLPKTNEVKIQPTKTAQSLSWLAKVKTTFSAQIGVLFCLFLFLSLSGVAIQNYTVSALTSDWYDFTESKATFAVTLYLVFSAIGVLVGGQMADKSKKHGLIATAALFVTILFAFILAIWVLPESITIALIALIGLLFGMIAPSRDMIVRNSAPKGQEGRVFGIVSMGFNVGGVIAPLILGFLIEQNYPSWVFYFCAICIAIATIIAFGQELKLRNRYQRHVYE